MDTTNESSTALFLGKESIGNDIIKGQNPFYYPWHCTLSPLTPLEN